MGRHPKFASEQILDAAAAVLARGGAEAATVVAIAAELGAPSGSIYHRFKARDLLIGRLWIRTVRRFQAGYLEALAEPDLERARESAVRHVLQWSADNPDEARILLLHSREELLSSWPDDLGDDLETLNHAVESAIHRYVGARFDIVDTEHVGRVRLALIDVPYAIVRHAMLSDEPIADWMTHAALAASAAIFDTSDRPQEQEKS